MSRLSARDFNQDVSAAKRAAEKEPVIITDRGKPSHVLVSIHEYRRLTGDGRSLVEALQMSEEDYFEVEFPRLDLQLREIDW